MYIPKHFKVTDFDEIREFIEHNAFGTIVTKTYCYSFAFGIT